MSIHSIVQDSYDRSFGLYRDLVESIEEGVLAEKLPQLRSNTVGLQLWCVIGARESFAKAIEANEWLGFSCSLETTVRKESVADSLRQSAEGVSRVLADIEIFSDVQNRLVIDLLEHEAAHQGQLIRYLYGLQLAIPDSWKRRFNLE